MELPGKGLVKGYESGGQGSIAAAGSVWGAVGAIGEQISAQSDKYADHLIKMKEVDIRRRAAEMEMEFTDLQTNYETEMLKNPNMTPEEAAAGWQKVAVPFSEKYQQDGMSPVEQEVLGMRSKQLAQRGQLGVARSAAVANLQSSKQTFINLAKKGEEIGGEKGDEMRNQAWAGLHSVMPEANIEAIKMDSDARVATNRVVADINSNPVEMQERLKDPEKFIGENPGVSISDIPQLSRQADQASRAAVSNYVDSFHDGLATDQFKTPEDIERTYAGRVPPRTIDTMKSQWAERVADSDKLRMQSPEYRALKEGEAANLVKGVQGQTGDAYDKSYADASYALSVLPPSAAKEYQQEKLRALKEGREMEIKTHKAAGFKAIEVYNQRLRDKLPQMPKKMLTADAVEAGFLHDRDKLSAIGFGEDERAAIMDAKSGADRLQKFRELWTKRGKASDNVDQQTWQTARSIITGANEVNYVSPEVEDAAISASLEADRQDGQRMMKLSEFIQVNPDATSEQIDDKILDISNEQTQQELKSGIYERGGDISPKGAGSSTSYFPVGKDISEVVKNFEAGGAPGGFHPKAYWDVEQWSIGYGTKSKEGATIDKSGAEKALSSELSAARSEVEDRARKLNLKFTDNEKDALTSFVYNLGGGNLDQLLAGGNRSKSQIADMMLTYRNAGGKRLFGLEKRRAAERELFLKGYPNTVR